MRPSAAILQRDATRLSRRWQTHGLRTAFSGALLALVLAFIWFVTEFQQQFLDPGKLGDLGRYLFVGFSVVQVGLAAVVAPHAAASAVIDEREQDTLDVLLLTRLTSRQLLFGKVTTRLMVIASLVVGALPVLAVVTTLGGVSVVEVVSVCVHALTTVVVLGAMGAFFAIFTRYAVLATFAAVGFGALAFTLMPALYLMLVPSPGAASAFSPLTGTVARDASALLPAAAYVLPTLLVMRIGARIYDLRVSGSHPKRLLESGVWGGRTFTWLLLATLLLGVTVVPIVMVVSWVLELQHVAGWVLLTRAALFAWCLMVLQVCTWGYLRVVVDVVWGIDDVLSHAGEARIGVPKIWWNAVAWRELHGRFWRQVGPAVATWGLLMFGIGMTGLWLIPGAMLALGALTVGLGIAQGAWLLAGRLASERADDSFALLMTTRLSAPSVVFGKLTTAFVASAPFMAGGLPLVFVGAPHLQVLFVGDAGPESLLWATGIGLLACVWLVALWFVVVLASFVVGIRSSRPEHAAPVVMIASLMVLAVPAVLSASLPRESLVQIPLRLISPVLVSHPIWWEICLSLGALSVVAVALFTLCCVKLRPWGTADVA